MLSDILRENGIAHFAALPLGLAKIQKEYLLRDIPNATYAVFFLIPYFTGRESNLAEFAAVPDYHAFVRKVSGEAEEYIRSKYGKAACGFADHSPFDERDCALSCGFGVLGDHGLLITKEYSSFVCVGEIVCELDGDELASEGITVLNESLPHGECEHCGACRRACPASATEDKSRCLAYITQKKGELEDWERSLVASSPYVWGCDSCQLACPHTKEAISSGTIFSGIDYFGNSHIDKMTAKLLSRMSDEEYASYTFSWRKREVMLRNLKIKGDSDD